MVDTINFVRTKRRESKFLEALNYANLGIQMPQQSKYASI